MPVIQKKWSDMTEGERALHLTLRQKLSLRLSSIEWDDLKPEERPRNDTKETFRTGILNLKTDDPDKPRELFLHQAIFAHRFLTAHPNTASMAVRNTSMLAMHDMGTGKTISAILCIAGIYKQVPSLQDFLVLIVVPLSLLDIWVDTLREWTTLGNDIVKARYESDITEKALIGPKVIVATRDAIVAAWKTFMWYDPHAESYETEKGVTKYVARWVQGTNPALSAKQRAKRAKRAVNGVVPKHPLFAHIERCSTMPCPDRFFKATDPKANHPNATTPAFAGVVIDEVHEQADPKTQFGYIMAEVCASAGARLGLSGTPVQSKPQQVAHVCNVLQVEPKWLREPVHWVPKGRGNGGIRTDTVGTFLTDSVTDRVDENVIELVKHKIVLMQFDPFIGRIKGQPYDQEAQEIHDSWIHRAHKAAAIAANGGKKPDRYIETLWAMFTTTVQFCFNNVLGHKGAAAFDGPYALANYKEALKQPSEQMRLIWRTIRDRQKQGHGRIVIFSQQVVMLKMLLHQLEEWGECGSLFLYVGESSLAQRGGMIKEFLDAEKTPRGVFCMSKAGALGVTLCPGCDTLFVVGEMPWTLAELQQAMKRIHRIRQDKPVEFVIFEPRRSIISAKLEAHKDEELRLYKAIRDGDWSNFDQQIDQWRTRNSATLNMSGLDELGNYKPTAEQERRIELHKQDVEAAEANGDTPPPLPEELVIPEPVLADDYEIKKCTYPVEGFVEQPLKPKPNPSFAYVMNWNPPQPKEAGPAVGKKRVIQDDDSDSEFEEGDLNLLPDTDSEDEKPMSKAEGKKPMRQQMGTLSAAEKKNAEIERARSLRKLFETFAADDVKDPFGFGV